MICLNKLYKLNNLLAIKLDFSTFSLDTFYQAMFSIYSISTKNKQVFVIFHKHRYFLNDFQSKLTQF